MALFLTSFSLTYKQSRPSARCLCVPRPCLSLPISPEVSSPCWGVRKACRAPPAPASSPTLSWLCLRPGRDAKCLVGASCTSVPWTSLISLAWFLVVVCLFVFIFWPSFAACGDLSSPTGDGTRASSSGSVASSPPGKCVSFVITKGPAALPLHLQCGRPGFDSLGQEDPLEERMATHSSILAWRIPRTEEPGGLQSMGSQRAGHEPATKHTHWENMCICRPLLLPLLFGAYPHFLTAPFPVFLAWLQLFPASVHRGTRHPFSAWAQGLCHAYTDTSWEQVGPVCSLLGHRPGKCLSQRHSCTHRNFRDHVQPPGDTQLSRPRSHPSNPSCLGSSRARPVRPEKACEQDGHLPSRAWQNLGLWSSKSFLSFFFFYFNKCYIKYTGQSTPFPCDGVHGSKIVPTLGHPFFRIYVKRRKFCLPGLFPSP